MAGKTEEKAEINKGIGASSISAEAPPERKGDFLDYKAGISHSEKNSEGGGDIKPHSRGIEVPMRLRYYEKTITTRKKERFEE